MRIKCDSSKITSSSHFHSEDKLIDLSVESADSAESSAVDFLQIQKVDLSSEEIIRISPQLESKVDLRLSEPLKDMTSIIETSAIESLERDSLKKLNDLLQRKDYVNAYIIFSEFFDPAVINDINANVNKNGRRELYNILLTEYAHHIAFYLLKQSNGISEAEKLYSITEGGVNFIEPIDQVKFYLNQGDIFCQYPLNNKEGVGTKQAEFYISSVLEKVTTSILRAYSNALLVASQQNEITSKASKKWDIEIERIEKRLHEVEILNLAHLYLDLESQRHINANIQFDQLMALLVSFEKGLPKGESWENFKNKFEKLFTSIPISFLRVDELYEKSNNFLNKLQNAIPVIVFDAVKKWLSPLEHEFQSDLNDSYQYQALRNLFMQLYPLLDQLLILGAQESINCIYQRLRPWSDGLYKLFEGALSIAKGRSLEQFLEVSQQLLILIDPWVSHNQFSIARPCYKAVIVHAKQKAGSFKVRSMREKLNQCDLAKIKLSLPSHLKSKQNSFNKTFNHYREIVFNVMRTHSKPITHAQIDFTQQMGNFFQTIVEKALSILGKAPCGFAILGTGSISRQELSPASDIDIALLIEQEQYRSDDYFQTLIKAIKIQLLCLGEHRCLLPDCGAHLEKLGDFLDTPRGLADRYPYNEIFTDHPESHSLHRAIELYSSKDGKKLFSEYQQNIRNQLQLDEFKSEEKQQYPQISLEKKYKHQIHALSQLEKILKRKPLPEKITNIKKDYIHPIMLVCSHLAMYFGWKNKEGGLVSNIILILKMFKENKIVSPAFVRELYDAWEYLQRLRIEAYSVRLRTRALSLERDQVYWSTEKPKVSNLSAPLLTVEQTEMLQRIDRLILRPFFQVLNEWVENKIEIKEPLDPVLFQIQKLYVDPTKDPSLFVQRPEDEKIIEALVETLYLRKASPISYLKHYRKLPDALKIIFFNTLNKHLMPLQNNIEIPSKLTSLIAEYADDQDHPLLEESRISFNNAGNTFYVPTLEEDLVRVIGSYPLSNGFRFIYKEKQDDWQDKLLQFTQPLPRQLMELFVKKQSREFKKELGSQILVQWIKPNGEPINRLLKASLQQYWLINKWINEKNVFQPKARNAINVKCQRIVVPLQEEDGKPILAYAKIYPEFAGMQQLSQSLAWRLSGIGPLTTLCKFTTQDDTYPVLFSEPVDETLQSINLEEKSPDGEMKGLERIKKNLMKNPGNFTRKFLETLLCNYEDDKLDNIGIKIIIDAFGNKSYRFVSFDSDRAFVGPVYKEQFSFGNVLKRKYKVNVKSIIYCMDRMQDPLDKESVDEFLSLDIYKLLLDWLTECEVIENAYREKIFTAKELERYSDQSDNKSNILSILGPEEAGTIKAIYQKFHRIQAALRDKQDFPANHLELHQRIDPQLYNFYETFLTNKSLDCIQRFELLPTDYIIVEQKIPSTKSTTSVDEKKQTKSDEKILPTSKSLESAPESFSKMIKYQDKDRCVERTIKSLISTISPPIKNRTQEICKSLPKPSLFSLKQAKVDLKAINDDNDRIKEIRTKLLHGRTKQFSNLKNSDYLRERIIQGINFSEIKESWIQERIIGEMKDGGFQNIYLSGCVALDNFALITIISNCPDLQTLDISDCTQISMIAIQKIPELCPHLQKLNLSGLSNFKFLSDVNLLATASSGPLKFPNLRRLTIENCKKLTHIEIEAPHLETISTLRCDNLKTVSVIANKAKLLKKDELDKVINFFNTLLHESKKYLNESRTIKAIKSFKSFQASIQQQILLIPFLNQHLIYTIDDWLKRWFLRCFYEIRNEKISIRSAAEIENDFWLKINSWAFFHEDESRIIDYFEAHDLFDMQEDIAYILDPLYYFFEFSLRLIYSRSLNSLMMSETISYMFTNALKSLMLLKALKVPVDDAELFSIRKLWENKCVLNLITELIVNESGLQTQLFSIIERSKNDRKVARHAAIAISLLNYAKISLSHKDFQRIRIPGANLSGALLQSVVFSNAFLKNVDFTNADLYNADFTDAYLYKATFSGASLKQAVFESLQTEVNSEKQLLRYYSRNSIVSDKFLAHSKEISCIAFSLDGINLATGDDDGKMCLWDTIKFSIIHVFLYDKDDKYDFGIKGVAFCPNKTYLASSSKYKIRLWNISDFTLVYVFEDRSHENLYYNVTFTSDNKYIALSSKKGIMLCDLETRTTVTTINAIDEVKHKRFKFVGGYVVYKVYSQKDTLSERNHIISLQHFLEIACDDDSVKSMYDIRFSSDGLYDVRFSSDGLYLALRELSPAREFILFDVINEKELYNNSEYCYLGLNVIAFCPDNCYLAEIDFFRNLRIVKIATGVCVHKIKEERNVTSIDWCKTPYGSLLAMGYEDGSIRFWRVTTNYDKGLKLSLLWSSHDLFNCTDANFTYARGLDEKTVTFLKKNHAIFNRMIIDDIDTTTIRSVKVKVDDTVDSNASTNRDLSLPITSKKIDAKSQEEKRICLHDQALHARHGKTAFESKVDDKKLKLLIKSMVASIEQPHGHVTDEHVFQSRKPREDKQRDEEKEQYDKKFDTFENASHQDEVKIFQTPATQVVKSSACHKQTHDDLILFLTKSSVRAPLSQLNHNLSFFKIIPTPASSDKLKAKKQSILSSSQIDSSPLIHSSLTQSTSTLFGRKGDTTHSQIKSSDIEKPAKHSIRRRSKTFDISYSKYLDI